MAVDASFSSTTTAGRFPVRRPPVLVVLSAVILLGLVVLTVSGQWLAPLDPGAQDLMGALRPPGGAHLLGTDDLGRDVLSRLIAGTRLAMLGPLVVATGCALLGGSLGLLAGYTGGIADAVVGRLTDVMYTLPGLLVAIVLVGIAGGGYWLTALVLIALSFPFQTRMCRSAALGESRLAYLDAARTLGVSGRRIIYRHLLPNITPTMFSTFLLDFTGAMIGYSGLDYLGLGVAPGQPDWGGMIAVGQSYISANPWISMAPALAIILVATSATLFGDWVYDQLSVRTQRS
jgi:ABC-type dipeptide/oligopeptide/nickel transport system permease subunit